MYNARNWRGKFHSFPFLRLLWPLRTPQSNTQFPITTLHMVCRCLCMPIPTLWHVGMPWGMYTPLVCRDTKKKKKRLLIIDLGQIITQKIDTEVRVYSKSSILWQLYLCFPGRGALRKHCLGMAYCVWGLYTRKLFTLVYIQVKNPINHCSITPCCSSPRALWALTVARRSRHSQPAWKVASLCTRDLGFEAHGRPGPQRFHLAAVTVWVALEDDFGSVIAFCNVQPLSQTVSNIISKFGWEFVQPFLCDDVTNSDRNHMWMFTSPLWFTWHDDSVLSLKCFDFETYVWGLRVCPKANYVLRRKGHLLKQRVRRRWERVVPQINGKGRTPHPCWAQGGGSKVRATSVGRHSLSHLS